ncbi:MAG: arginase [Candidatus Tectomicrobia bacterium]|uniref:Arginase n=1 Tax=Tectimicrobiota bacterium TaxID=2528274 RepID=A0A932GQM2_UNCTE|nr:arginase [Candidatus Tectomicrobia bacterium]
MGPVDVLGVPLDLGAGRRGVDMGPSALRVAGLHRTLRGLGHQVIDCGDLSIPIAETRSFGHAHLKFLQEIAETCTRLAREVEGVFRKGGFPLVLGGDHSLAIGSVSGAASYWGPSKFGLIWFDAHGDLNTPATTPTGNIHGMPLAVLLGYGDLQLAELGSTRPKLSGKDTVLVGVRRLDPGERELLAASGVTVFTMRDIDEMGMKAVIQAALKIATADGKPLHVSFDIDVIDPGYAPGVGTPANGGITYREAHLAMELIADCQRLSSFDCVEINPLLDNRNRTAALAVELIGSAFGKSIL